MTPKGQCVEGLVPAGGTVEGGGNPWEAGTSGRRKFMAGGALEEGIGTQVPPLLLSASELSTGEQLPLPCVPTRTYYSPQALNNRAK